MIDDSQAGLYIHIPFCQSKCHYCGFYSATDLALMPAFLKALQTEMEFYKCDFPCFDTIYIGGGTPSLLAPGELACLLEAIAGRLALSADVETTLEANPADLDRRQLEALRHMGINRLNLGIQSFDDSILHFLGRRHNCNQAIRAIEAAREAGFDNLGFDLIYGVPGQDISSWKETLRLALYFQPAHLSCYQLTLEPGTPLASRHSKGKITMPDEAKQADFFFQTSYELKKAGYHHYEISNFARDEASSSRHNQKYWHHEAYLGMGPAAHSFLGNKRWWNKTDLAQYLRDCGNGIAPVEATESLTTDNLRLEALFLGLRTRRGINLTYFNNRYGYDLLSEKADAIAQFSERGLLEIKDGFLCPTPAGMAVADTLALI